MRSFAQLPLRTIYDSNGDYVVHFGICEVSTESEHRPMHFAAGQKYTLSNHPWAVHTSQNWTGTLYSVSQTVFLTFPIRNGSMRNVLMALKCLLGVNWLQCTFLAPAAIWQFQISPEPPKPLEITRKMMWSFVQLPLRTIYDSIGGYVVGFGICEV